MHGINNVKYELNGWGEVINKRIQENNATYSRQDSLCISVSTNNSSIIHNISIWSRYTILWTKNVNKKSKFELEQLQNSLTAIIDRAYKI